MSSPRCYIICKLLIQKWLFYSLTIHTSDDEWFPGIITAAIPNEGTFDIAYDDGDVAESQHGDCIQRMQTQ